ncbi:MAG: lamin tail domain-containing protein [Opitutales bacterium]|nr:lamin tail domain-containing protein [Opitutales bacterium]
MKRLTKTIKTCLLAGAFALAGQFASAQEMLFQESFETDGEGERYIVIGGGDNPDDPRMAFARRRVGTTGTLGQGDLLDGDWMWMARRMTTVPGPRGDEFEGEGLSDRDARLKFPDIDVSGYGELSVRLVIMVGAPGHEPNDDFKMRVRFDGGEWQEIGGFRSSTSNSWPIYYQGPSDTMTVQDDPNKLIRFFTEWEWPIYNHGDEMELQLTFSGNAFNEDWYVDNIRIFGESDLGFFDLSFAEDQVTEPEAGADGVRNDLTITLNEPAPAGGASFTLTPPDYRTASSLSLPEEPVVIAEGETSVVVPVEIVQDNQYTGLKRIDLFVSGEGYNTGFARTFVENVTPRPKLIFTEALNVVPGIGVGNIVEVPVGDANNDGDIHNTRDQFIELVNIDDHPVDLSGYRIGDDLDDRHLIPDGTILYPNTALVVFGGGEPRGTFGGAIVQVASGGGNGLGLNIASRAEIMYLTAPFGAEVELVNIWMQRADIWAITQELDPEHHAYNLSGSFHRTSLEWTEPGFEFGPEHLHFNIPGATQNLYAPGTWYDGTPYFDPENELTLTVSEETILKTDGRNAAVGQIVLAEPAPEDGLKITLDTNGVRSGANGEVIPYIIDLDSIELMVPAGDTSIEFRIGAHNDGVLTGDRIVGLTARAGPYVLPGFQEFTVLETMEDDLNLVINEVYIDSEGGAIDMNGDGISGDPMSDQFIEIVNLSGRPVNLAGFRIWWDSGSAFAIPRDVHYFSGGTWIPDQGAVVVFGTFPQDTMQHPDYGGATVLGARNADGSLKRNGLDLDTSNMTLRIDNPYGYTVAEAEIDSSLTAQDQSMVRSPELTGEFKLHLEVASTEYLRFDIATPGLATSGDPFAGNGGLLSPFIYFPQIVEKVVPGLWYRDSSFGWIGLDAQQNSDSAWVYAASFNSWWYLPESYDNGLWIYDQNHETWFFTHYNYTPWMWNYNTEEWVDRSAL